MKTRTARIFVAIVLALCAASAAFAAPPGTDKETVIAPGLQSVFARTIPSCRILLDAGRRAGYNGTI